MPTKKEALEKIKSLVERFDDQKEFYKNKDYNETQTRRDFIDPFWEALGWEVANKQGWAESYREVIHEDRKETKRRNKRQHRACLPNSQVWVERENGNQRNYRL